MEQGDILAPTLFTIFVAVVLQEAFRNNENGIYIRYRSTGKLLNIIQFIEDTKVSTALVRDLLYADDCDLVTYTEWEMQVLMGMLFCRMLRIWVRIQYKKTVVMYTPAPGKEYVEPSIFVNGKIECG